MAAPHHHEETGDADEKIVSIASGLISAQIVRGGDPLRAKDAFARGYALGVCDVLCQAAGIEEEERCLALTMFVLLDVFGEAEGEAFGRMLLVEAGHDASLDGQMAGGRDAVAWLNRKDDRTAPAPRGLAAYLEAGAAA